MSINCSTHLLSSNKKPAVSISQCQFISLLGALFRIHMYQCNVGYFRDSLGSVQCSVRLERIRTTFINLLNMLIRRKNKTEN